MLSPELLGQIKQIQLQAGHQVNDILSGEYISAFKGQGMEFDEVREYQPGDEIRTIDWNVTARMNQPFVKVFREERQQTVYLLVDVSPSQHFGSVGKSKNQVAAEFAAVLAFLAIRNNDRIGLSLFSDHLENFMPPMKGRGHVWRIIRQVLTYRPEGKRTSISAVIDHLMQVAKRKSLVVLISDFVADEDYNTSFKQLAKKHDLICAKVTDPRESQIPSVGLIDLQDSETGEVMTLDSSSPTVRQALGRLVQKRHGKFADLCRSLGIDMMELSTDGDLVKALTGLLKRRERRVFR